MQRLTSTAIKRSSRYFYRFMSTEAKGAADAASASTAKVAENATQAAPAASKVAQQTVSKAAQAPKAPKAPKTPKAPKASGNEKSTTGKAKTYTIGTLAVLLGAGGLYRYHTGNDHLSCINSNKGGGNSNFLESIYLVPKDLEGKYENYMYTTYVDRLIYEILHNNPLNFKIMDDVTKFFGKWFTTLGIEIDGKAPLSDEALVEMFAEFSKQENMFNIFIIGERFFGVSPMTDYMAQAASRLFDAQRKKSHGKYYIPMSAVIECVETIQEKTKEKYFTSAFIPNWANKLLSSAARSVKKQPLLEKLRNSEQERMEIYDFVKLMALIERQHKAKKVRNDDGKEKKVIVMVSFTPHLFNKGKNIFRERVCHFTLPFNKFDTLSYHTMNRWFYLYVDNYVELKLNEALFAGDEIEEEEEEEESEEVEVVEEAEKAEEEEPSAEVAEQVVEEPEVTIIVEEEEIPKEVTIDTLLDDLDGVHSQQWNKLLTADWNSLKALMEEERAIKKELNKMNWW